MFRTLPVKRELPPVLSDVNGWWKSNIRRQLGYDREVEIQRLKLLALQSPEKYLIEKETTRERMISDLVDRTKRVIEDFVLKGMPVDQAKTVATSEARKEYLELLKMLEIMYPDDWYRLGKKRLQPPWARTPGRGLFFGGGQNTDNGNDNPPPGPHIATPGNDPNKLLQPIGTINPEDPEYKDTLTGDHLISLGVNPDAHIDREWEELLRMDLSFKGKSPSEISSMAEQGEAETMRSALQVAKVLTEHGIDIQLVGDSVTETILELGNVYQPHITNSKGTTTQEGLTVEQHIRKQISEKIDRGEITDKDGQNLLRQLDTLVRKSEELNNVSKVKRITSNKMASDNVEKKTTN